MLRDTRADLPFQYSDLKQRNQNMDNAIWVGCEGAESAGEVSRQRIVGR